QRLPGGFKCSLGLDLGAVRTGRHGEQRDGHRNQAALERPQSTRFVHILVHGLAHQDQLPLMSTSGPPAEPPSSDPSSRRINVRRRELDVMRISPKKILPKSFTTTEWWSICAAGSGGPSHPIVRTMV